MENLADQLKNKRRYSDQQLAQVVQQALKDDPAVAGHIQVTVKDGEITLDGQVFTDQQMNLATNTATAIGIVDEINNRLVIKEESENLFRADDDGFKS